MLQARIDAEHSQQLQKILKTLFDDCKKLTCGFFSSILHVHVYTIQE